MTGSEKQIAWAEKIEKEAIECCDRNIELLIARNDNDKAESFKIIKNFLENGFSKMDSAALVIERRDLFNPSMMYTDFSLIAQNTGKKISEVTAEKLNK